MLSINASLCGQQLYLTGSAFFEDVADTGDIDFFTENTPVVHTFLSKYAEQTSDYKTADVTFRYRGAHIQLVSDVRNKLRAQRFIKDSPELRAILAKKDKETNSLVWEFALRQIYG